MSSGNAQPANSGGRRTTPPVLRLYLLGGFRAERSGGAPVADHWPRPSARRLVELLAVSPGRVRHREEIIEMCWPDTAGTPAALGSLRVALHAARRALQPELPPRHPSAYLVSEGALLRLPMETVWIDADEAERLAEGALRARGAMEGVVRAEGAVRAGVAAEGAVGAGVGDEWALGAGGAAGGGLRAEGDGERGLRAGGAGERGLGAGRAGERGLGAGRAGERALGARGAGKQALGAGDADEQALRAGRAGEQALHAGAGDEWALRAGGVGGRAPYGGRTGELARALKAFTGELLPEHRYTPWVQARREGLDALRDSVRLALAEACLADGEIERAAATARAVLADSAAEERAHRVLIAAYLRQGMRRRALAQYHQCRRALDAEWGVLPGPETEALHRAALGTETYAVRRPAPARPAPPPPALLRTLSEAQFVGRRAELERLLNPARPALSVIDGEAGIGKTRLAAEAARRAAANGAAVLWGAGHDEGPQAPYGLFVEALEGWLAGRATEDRARIAAEYPELAALLPSLGQVGVVPGRGPEYERERIFSAVSGLLGLAAVPGAPGSGGGVLVVLDDVHAADMASLQLLARLARRTPPPSVPRLRFLATYRPEDLPETDPRRAVLDTLVRQGTADRLRLQRLARRECLTLAAEVMPGEGTPAALHRVWELSLGHPLFALELAKAGLPPTGTHEDLTAPEGVRLLVNERLSRLSPAARRVIEVVAVAAGGVATLTETEELAASAPPSPNVSPPAPPVRLSRSGAGGPGGAETPLAGAGGVDAAGAPGAGTGEGRAAGSSVTGAGEVRAADSSVAGAGEVGRADSSPVGADASGASLPAPASRMSHASSPAPAPAPASLVPHPSSLDPASPMHHPSPPSSPSPSSVVDGIDMALAAGVLEERSVAVGGVVVGGLGFRHPLMRVVCLEGLSQARRRQLHAGYAELLLRRRPGAVDAVAVHLAGADDPRAADHLHRAARRAAAVGADDTADHYYGELTARLDAVAVEAARIRLDHATVLRRMARHEDAVRVLREALADLHRHGTPAEQARAAAQLAESLAKTGAPQEGFRVLDTHRPPQDAPPQLHATHHLARGFLCFVTGDYEGSLNAARRAQQAATTTMFSQPAPADGESAPPGPPAPDHAGRTGGAGGQTFGDGGAAAAHPGLLARALAQQSTSLALTGRLPQARAAADAALPYAEAHGDPRLLAAVLSILREHERRSGRLRDAVVIGRRALDLADRCGDPEAAAFERANLAEVHLLLGEFTEAAALATEAVDEAQAHAGWCLPYALTALARVQLRGGPHRPGLPSTRELLARAADCLARRPDRQAEYEVRTAQAELALKDVRPDRALTLLSDVSGTGVPVLAAWAHLTAGDPARAADVAAAEAVRAAGAGEAVTECEARTAQAAALAVLGRTEEAATCAGRVRELAETLPYPTVLRRVAYAKP